MGRTLGKVFEAEQERVFGAAAFSAAIREDVKVDSVHADTTMWALTRVYADSIAEGEALRITYGFGRDKLSCLKQFKYGLVVGGDGIPLMGEATDGNKSDKVWNRHIIEELVSKLSSDLTGKRQSSRRRAPNLELWNLHVSPMLQRHWKG